MSFELPCKIMILIGIVIMFLLTVLFILLLKTDYSYTNWNIISSLLKKLHFKAASERLKNILKLHSAIMQFTKILQMGFVVQNRAIMRYTLFVPRPAPSRQDYVNLL